MSNYTFDPQLRPLELCVMSFLLLLGVVFDLWYLSVFKTQILRHHEHPAMRVRFPRTLHTCIVAGCAHLVLSPCIFCLQVTSNNENVKRLCLYTVTSLTCAGPFAWNLIRFELLWFETKKNRQQRSCLTIKLNRKKFCFTSRYPWFGRPSVVALTVFLSGAAISLLWLIVFMSTKSADTAGYLIKTCIACAVLLHVLMAQSLYRCGCRRSFLRSFRDAWQVRVEMTCFVVVQVFALLGILVHDAIPHSDTIKSNSACLVYASLMSLVGILILLISLEFPLRGIKEWERSQLRVSRAQTKLKAVGRVKYKSSSQVDRSNTIGNIKTQVKLITMASVCTDPELFDMFVEHLSVELGIESLLFLIEVWQFKFADRIPPRLLVSMRLGLVSWQSSFIESLSEIQLQVEDAEKDEKADEKQDNKIDENEEKPKRQGSVAKRKLAFNELLARYNWTDLPLSDAYMVAPRNKAKQALWIFDCYVSRNAFDRINIGGKAYQEIYKAIKKLCLNYQYDSNRRSSIGLTGLRVSAFDKNVETMLSSMVETDSHCNYRLFKTLCLQGCCRRGLRDERSSISLSSFTKKRDVFFNVVLEKYDDIKIRDTFDCALPAILDNLNDSLIRFKRSDKVLEFVLAHQAIFSDDVA